MAEFTTGGSQAIAVTGQQQVQQLDTSQGGVASALADAAKIGVEATVDFKTGVREKSAKEIAEASQAGLVLLSQRKQAGLLGQATQGEIDEGLAGLLPEGFSKEVLETARHTFGQLAAARRAGVLTKADFGVVVNSNLKQLIANNEAFEDDIIKAATKELGFDPTPSAMNQALATFAPKPKKTETRWDKQYGQYIQQGHTPENATNMTNDHFERVDLANIDAQNIIHNRKTSESLTSFARNSTLIIEASIGDQIDMRRQGGTLTERAMKDNIVGDIQQITQLFNNKMNDLRRIAPPNADTTLAMKELTAARDNMIQLRESGDIVKFLDRSDAVYQALITHDSQAFSDFRIMKIMDPSYASEFNRLYNYLKDKPKALAARIHGDTKFASGLELVNAMKAQMAAREKRLAGQPVGITTEEKTGAIADSATAQNSIETPDPVALGAFQRNVKEIGRSNALGQANTDIGQVALGTKPKTLNAIFSSMDAEYKQLIAETVEMAERHEFLIINNRVVLEDSKQSMNPKGRQDLRIPRSYVQKVNQLLDLQERYQVEGIVIGALLPTKGTIISPPRSARSSTSSRKN